MSDIVKIREWVDDEGREGERDSEDGYDWPAPPEYVESSVEGELRLAVLRKIGREDDTDATVRIIEGAIEGGWSEFTVEMDYDIEVWVDHGRQSQRVFQADGYHDGGALADFLRWAEEAHTPTSPATKET